MTYRSKTLIKPFDIFFAEVTTPYGKKRKHYYLCIYSQPYDFNNPLQNDVLALVITTNQKYKKIDYNDYNAPILIGDKTVFVCCDKIIRLPMKDLELKQQKITKEERSEIQRKFLNFNKELLRQIQIKEN